MMGAEQKLVERKLALLKRSGLFNGDTKGAIIERAYSLEDLQAAYHLVYQIYLECGFITPDPSSLKLRIYETTSETATFVAKKDGKIVGVLSVVHDSSDLGLPSNTSFKKELDSLRTPGVKICELTNQVVADEYRKTGVAIELMRCAIAHMLKTDCDYAIATVSPSHQGFYGLIGFKSFGHERSYSDEVYDPVVALRLPLDYYRQSGANLTESAKYIHGLATTHNPYIEKVFEWKRRSISSFLSLELLEQLFAINSDYIAKCTPDELKILKRRWGEELFNAVTTKVTAWRLPKSYPLL